MMERLVAGVFLGVMMWSGAAAAAGGEDPAALANKDAAAAAIEEHSADLIALSDQIWRYAELALRETQSARALSDYAERQGFHVERAVAGMPTAFVATYGKGKPIIGVLGEYDALPGLSQKAEAKKEPLEPGAGGHGCGHNLFGVGSLGAAIAVKERIEAGELSGTVRFYGTPAEESVGGKIYMAREGLFDDLDLAVAWHPGSENKVDTGGSLAMVDFYVDFAGHAAHAAYDPWDGRSALDGLELLTHGLNLMREHVRPTVRIHYTIPNGGDVPNVVPEKARLWCWVRDQKKADVDELLDRIRDVARGAALAAGVQSKLSVQSGSYEMLVNLPAARAMQRNMEHLGPLEFTEKEQAFARAVQKESGVETVGLVSAVSPLVEKPGPTDRGSTDLADVSWVVPTVELTVTTAPDHAPWHAWPVVASGGMSIGHKGMLYAAKVMASTMVDAYENPRLLEEIRTDFRAKTRGKKYVPYIPEGPPPVPAAQ